MSMNCPKCSAGNSSIRKFCRECGALMVSYCLKCGFGNLIHDKFCGGCGNNLAEMSSPAGHIREGAASGPAPGKYSSADITELIGNEGRKKEPPPKKKDLKPADSVSQDLLDSIFDSEEEG